MNKRTEKHPAPAGDSLQAVRGHIYTMAAAFAGVVFGIIGSMGFVGTYLDSRFAAQTAALDERLASSAPVAYNNGNACMKSVSSSGNDTKNDITRVKEQPYYINL